MMNGFWLLFSAVITVLSISPSCNAIWRNKPLPKIYDPAPYYSILKSSQFKEYLHQPYPDEFLEVVDEAADVLDEIRKHKHNNVLVEFMDNMQQKQKQTKKSENGKNVNEFVACWADVLKVFGDLVAGEEYAAFIADSWGRRPSGVLMGNLRWWGQYYECIQASDGEGVHGKWCEMHLGQYVVEHAGLPIGLSMGACFPDTCTDAVIEMGFDSATENITLRDKMVICPKPPKTLYARDIVAIFIISIIFVTLVGCTVYDVLVVHKISSTALTSNNRINLSLKQKLIKSFSVYSNTLIILDMTQRPNNMSVFDGMRFLSMTWVILGHIFYFLSMNIDNSRSFLRYVCDHFLFQAIANATFSVDTFFFIGGTLVAYLGFKAMEKTKGNINVPLAYLHRYLRITPAYAFVILFIVSLFRFIGSGPYYNEAAKYLYEGCQNDWWAQLIYIGNLYPAGMHCIGWGWYLNCDFQFYLLSPFILMIMYRIYNMREKKPTRGTFLTLDGSCLSFILQWWKKIGFGILAFFVVAQIAISAALIAEYDLASTEHGSLLFSSILGWLFNYDAPPSLELGYQYDIYTKPYCRMGVYTIGMATGYFLYITKRKRVKIPKFLVALGWILSTVIAVAVLYSVYPSMHDRQLEFSQEWIDTLYNSTSRILWGLCMAWLTIACVCGYGGPVKTLLCWKVLMPLSRLTFCAYLLHPLIIVWFAATAEQSIHFLVGQFVYIYLGTVMLSYGFGFVLSVCIELPFGGFFKVLIDHLMLSKRREVKPIQNGHNELNGKINKACELKENGVQVKEASVSKL